MNIDELYEESMKYPTWDERHIELREKIKEELKLKENHHDYVICFPTVTDETCGLQLTHLQNYFKGSSPIVSSKEASFFYNNRTFMDAGFEYHKRLELEYNILYKQLVVGALITSGEKILVLKSKIGRLSDKMTMVQGHVDYHASLLVKSQIDFLRDNALRELGEELSMNESAKNYLKEKAEIGYYISSNANYISMEHFGTIFTINVHEMEILENGDIRIQNEDNEIFNITSGEPEKHDLFVIENKEQYHEFVDQGILDDWLRLILEKHYEDFTE